MIEKKILLSSKKIFKTHGTLSEGKYPLCTDSRSYKSGEVFIALKGENFDGSRFLPDIAAKGCPLAVYSFREELLPKIEKLSQDFPQTCFLGVTDTLEYLQEVGKLHVQAWLEKKPERKVIGITGSNGKTTHKEMLFHFLNSLVPGKVVATQGNLNNHIGVPLTLASIGEEHELAIVEMGMNHEGEIALLTDLACPNAGLITNIGSAHIEFMGSEDNIYKEKSTLYHSVVQNTKGEGLFVVCADDNFLAKLPPSKGLVSFGENRGDVPVKLGRQEIGLPKQNIVLKNEHIVGAHNFKNMACTFILASQLFPGQEEKLQRAAADFTPRKNRASWLQIEDQNYFLDAYNANPSSMRVSLKAFVESLQFKNIPLSQALFVLGDMNELGTHAERFHKEIGELLLELGAQHVVFIGRYYGFYRQGFPKESLHFEKREDFYQKWAQLRRQFPYIFLKASRSLQLESLLDIK